MILGHGARGGRPRGAARSRCASSWSGCTPGRWDELRPATRQELKATTVLWTTISEASAKLRTGGPHDEPGDETWPAWAGLIPVQTRLGAPEPDEFVPEGMPAPRVSDAPVPRLSRELAVSVTVRRADASPRPRVSGTGADGVVSPVEGVLGLSAGPPRSMGGRPAHRARGHRAGHRPAGRGRRSGRSRVSPASSERADHTQLKDLWVEPAAMGDGVGRALWDSRGGGRPDPALRRAAARRGPQR